MITLEEALEVVQNRDGAAENTLSDNTLIMTVGLPRSGKSTWAKQQSSPVVSPDAIRLALHGNPFIGLAEDFIWAIAKVMVRALFISGHGTVILDATNTKHSRRERFRSHTWIRKFQVFDTDKEECIRRAKDGGKDFLVPVIERMAEEQEPIKEFEYDVADS